MNCKKCGKELEGELELCPECAAEETELTAAEETVSEETVAEVIDAEEAEEAAAEEAVQEEPAKEEKPAAPISIWKVVAATAVCMLLLCVLAVVMINSITGKNWPFDQFAKETTAAPTTVPTTVSTVPAELLSPEDVGMLTGITEKAVYSTDEMTDDVRDRVVATAGSLKLTNGQLQIMYWTQFYNFVNNQDYASYGLDPFAPLSEQKVGGVDATWEQVFLESALKTWHRYAAICLAAQEAGYVLPEDVQKNLDTFIEQFNAQAVKNGFADGLDLLTAQMGDGVTLEDMVAVETMYATGDGYFTQYRNNLNPTRDEVEAYFDENAELFSASYGVTKDLGKLVDVRHVLIQPEGCTFDTNNYVVATDEQWEACRKEAQAMLDGWVKDGAAEDGFAQLAKDHSVDGSAADGGLIQYVATGTMVENFDAWLFAEGRKAGDYGLVKTEFGYHLMYYVGGEEAWYLFGLNSSDGILSRKCSELIDSYAEANPMEVKFADILFGTTKLSVEDEAAESADPTTATE